jgi:hypothetical protein
MGDHIIPRVLLRGFSYNEHVSKSNQKINMLTPDKLIKGKINDLYQQLGFYSRETESILDREYESPFGNIKVKLREYFATEGKDEFILKNENYRFLLRFFVVMWRRNDKQINDAIAFAKNMLDNPVYRTMMLEKYKNVSSSELIKRTENELREELYRTAVKNTTDEDETVMKTYEDYLPVLIVNETDINFPLHNKYATILDFQSNSENHPDISIEPITRSLWMVLRKRMKHNTHGDEISIPVKYVKDEEIIKDMIRLYVLDSASSVVVDDTNLELVEDRLRRPDLNTFSKNSKRTKRVYDFLNT